MDYTRWYWEISVFMRWKVNMAKTENNDLKRTLWFVFFFKLFRDRREKNTYV